MGRKELVVKFLGWCIVPSYLVFLAIICFMPKPLPIQYQGVIFLLICAIAALVIFASEYWKDWLRE